MLSQHEIGDHLEITRLLARYTRAIDERAFARLETIFTSDAAIHFKVPGGGRFKLQELVAWLREALAVFRNTQHALSPSLIEVDGDRATASTYLIATHVQVARDGTERAIVLYGVYADHLVRTDAGWRIAERRLDCFHIAGEFLAPDQAQRFPSPAQS